MGFDLRGAVQGGAYANFYMQQAKYEQRKEEMARQKEQRNAEMQEQAMRIAQFQADLDGKRYEFDQKKFLDEQIARKAAEARLKEEDTHRRGIETKTADARVKQADLAEENMIMGWDFQERKLELEGRKITGLNDRAQLRADTQKLIAENRANTKARTGKEPPRTAGGLFSTAGDMYGELSSEIKDWKTKGVPAWVTSEVDLAAVEDVHSLVMAELEKRVNAMVNAYNAETELWNNAYAGTPTADNPTGAAKSYMDASTVMDGIETQISDTSTLLGRKRAQGDLTDKEVTLTKEKWLSNQKDFAERRDTLQLDDKEEKVLQVLYPAMFEEYAEKKNQKERQTFEEAEGKYTPPGHTPPPDKWHYEMRPDPKGTMPWHKEWILVPDADQGTE